MRAFLYDRYGDYSIYTGFSANSGDHEAQIRYLKTVSRMPMFTKIIVSGDRKRRIFCKEDDGWGKEQIFERVKSGWSEA